MNTTHPAHLERFLALSARHLGLDLQSHRGACTSSTPNPRQEVPPVALHSSTRGQLPGEERA